MKIVNPQVAKDLGSNKKLRLNLGSGGADSAGRYSVDHLQLAGVDIVADLNCPFDDLPNNSVSEIVTSHTLEHVQQFMPLMHEMHRIVAPAGEIRIVVPHFSSALAYSDPTHVRFFGLYSMYYFVEEEDQPVTRKVPQFYTNIKFKVESVEIRFYNWGTFVRRALGTTMTKFWNRSMKRQHFYETHLAYLYPADEIHFVIKPVK